MMSRSGTIPATGLIQIRTPTEFAVAIERKKIARIAVLVLLHRFCCSAVVVAWVVGGGTAQTILPSQYVMMFPGPSNRHSLTGWLVSYRVSSISYWMMRYETWWMMTTTHDCKNAHDTVAACLLACVSSEG